jgi:hypothetical protein
VRYCSVARWSTIRASAAGDATGGEPAEALDHLPGERGDRELRERDAVDHAISDVDALHERAQSLIVGPEIE